MLRLPITCQPDARSAAEDDLIPQSHMFRGDAFFEARRSIIPNGASPARIRTSNMLVPPAAHQVRFGRSRSCSRATSVDHSAARTRASGAAAPHQLCCASCAHSHPAPQVKVNSFRIPHCTPQQRKTRLKWCKMACACFCSALWHSSTGCALLISIAVLMQAMSVQQICDNLTKSLETCPQSIQDESRKAATLYEERAVYTPCLQACHGIITCMSFWLD